MDYFLVGHITQVFTSLIWDLYLQQVTENRLNIALVLSLLED